MADHGGFPSYPGVRFDTHVKSGSCHQDQVDGWAGQNSRRGKSCLYVLFFGVSQKWVTALAVFVFVHLLLADSLRS